MRDSSSFFCGIFISVLEFRGNGARIWTAGGDVLE